MAERITGTPDEPWSVERLGGELKSYIGRLGHLWVEGEITQWSNSRGNVFGKLGMRDRVQIVRYAIRRGLVEP